jgi:hypothetical protein
VSRPAFLTYNEAGWTTSYGVFVQSRRVDREAKARIPIQSFALPVRELGKKESVDRHGSEVSRRSWGIEGGKGRPREGYDGMGSSRDLICA